MPRVPSLALTALLILLASPAPRAEEPARPEGSARHPTIGSPMLAVIRMYGAPSQVRTVNLVPLAGGKPIQAMSWIYAWPTVTREFLIGEEGKVLQITLRSKSLDPFRIEPQP